MLKKKLRTVWISALILLVAILTGCQAVGGVDLTKVMTNNLKLTSYESASTFRVELLVNEDAELTEDEAQLVQLFEQFSIEFDDIKVQDLRTMSMSGTLNVQEESLDFTMTFDDEKMAIWIEGARQPIVIPNIPEDATLPPEMIELQKLLSGEAFTQSMFESMQELGQFIYKHFPNPGTVTVESVTETIDGQRLNLKKVHIELNGKELIDLVKTFLENVVQDQEGLKQTIANVYDLLIPTVTEVLNIVSEQTGDPSVAALLPYVENKEMVVEFLFTTLQGQIESFLENYDEYADELLSDEVAQQVFSEKNVLALDLYVDLSGKIYKQDLQLTLMFGAENDSIEGIRIYSQNEIWNHNGAVKAEQLDTSNALVWSENTSFETLLNGFEEDATVRQWLEQMNEWFTTTTVHVHTQLMIDMNAEEPIPGYLQQPYIENDATMVPIRYVSEELGAEVQWDAAEKRVTVLDGITGNEIVMVVGSDTAAINGEEVSLQAPSQIRENHVYVPLRFVAESFGAEVEWDHDSKLLIIERSY